MIRIRYYGHFDKRTGYGKAAEELALALPNALLCFLCILSRHMRNTLSTS